MSIAASRLGKKWQAAFILLAALAVEAANFRCGALALDPGSSTEMPWYLQILAFQWTVLHAAGLLALDWFDRRGVSGPRTIVVLPPGSLPPVSPSHHWGWIIIFIGGYISTALVLFAVTFSFQRFLRWKRKRSIGTARLANQI